MVVFFIGFMGSGKSFTAAAVAKWLGVPCVDLDAEIEKKEGKSISDIFAAQGEDHFRKLETAMLHEVVEDVENLAEKQAATTSRDLSKSNIFAIISCGGGTPCFHGNMDWMNQKGFTVWMSPPKEVIVERIGKEKAKRPLVSSLDELQLTQYVEEKLSEREKHYTKAKLKIANPELTPVQIVNSILDAQDLL